MIYRRRVLHKTATILLLSMLFSTPLAKAQTLYRKGNKTTSTENSLYLGAKIGISNSTFQFKDNSELKDISQTKLTKPILGLYLHRYKGNFLYGIELLNTINGSNIQYSPIECNKTAYKHEINYLNIRLPLGITTPLNKGFMPYIYAAPNIGFNYHSKLTKKNSSQEENSLNTSEELKYIDLEKASRFQANIIAGIGLKYKLQLPSYHLMIGVEMAQNWGISNTFPRKSTDNNTLDNSNIKIGKRYNRSREYTITIGIPLKKESQGACNFGK